MAFQTKDQEFILFALPSELGAIREVVLESEKFLLDCGVNDASKCSLALRELCSNAIVHGNLCNRNRSIYCSIVRMNASRFAIVLEDEGHGFDYMRLHFSGQPGHPKSQGYALLDEICETIEFTPPGNRVAAFIDFSNDRTHRGVRRALKEKGREWLHKLGFGHFRACDSLPAR